MVSRGEGCLLIHLSLLFCCFQQNFVHQPKRKQNPKGHGSNPVHPADRGYLQPKVTNIARDRQKHAMSSRYRQVRGGLDNAVKQAEDRGLYDIDVVDADCHYIPTLQNLAEYLGKTGIKYELPRDMETDPSLVIDMGEKYAVLKAISDFNSAAFGDREHSRRLYSAFSSRVTRSADRTRGSDSAEKAFDRFSVRMHDIGIKYSLIYPQNMVMGIGMMGNAKFEAAICNAFMDYMLENLLGKDESIQTFIPVPASDPDEAVKLIERVGSEKGVVGAAMSPTQKRIFGDKHYDPIYEILEKKRLPITIHGSPYGGPPLAEFEKVLPLYSLEFPIWMIKQLVSVVSAGLPERYPGLKWVWVEGGLSWIPWIMNRLDTFYNLNPDDEPILKKMPSQYIKEMYFSSQPLERPYGGKGELEWIFKAFDAENHLMYASDLPHVDFDLPSTVCDLPFLSKRAKNKIMGENALKLYNKIR
jgi:predicted TIM-barrel fold metal-dependent hydrolase